MRTRFVAVVSFIACLFALGSVGSVSNAQIIIDFKSWSASQKPVTIQGSDEWVANTLFHLAYPTPPSHPITYVEYRATSYSSGGGGNPTDVIKVCYVSPSGIESDCISPDIMVGTTVAFAGQSSLGQIRIYHKRFGGLYPAYPSGNDSVTVHW